MRDVLQKELLAYFIPAFDARLPYFSRRTEFDDPCWSYELRPDLTFFVLLVPFEKWDRFTIDIAWSNDRLFPFEAFSSTANESAPRLRERLARLWSNSQEAPTWDFERERTLEETLAGYYPPSPPVSSLIPLVKPLADDAVQKITQYGISLFRHVALQRGLVWPH